ncbi:lyase [Sphaerisporangium melleum]|uniref:Lyase n=1 Tax=Sphaerisporangium melleum TaxID=321316 RepID=A0A917VVX9_9ACTN|nr:polysaccharide lyase 8 family protein [Sphaerisporangium melleum]GGL20030.1 lyase [Sphaerisporangium melleum]GII71320.1 lyase [Sphaerisporangium melleum]
MDAWGRRSFLRAGGLAAAGVLITASGAPSGDGAAFAGMFAGHLAALRRRWREVTAGSGFDPAAEPYRTRLAALGTTAARYRDTAAPAAGRLWPDEPFPSFVATPARLLTMARAYALPGTGLTGDAGLAAAVSGGIDHYRRRVYAEGAPETGNWWHWQIGVPKKLLDAAVLIEPHLPDGVSRALAGAVDHFVPERHLHTYSGTSTGANRVDLCVVMLLRAMLRSDPGKAAVAVSALSPVFPYAEEGDGFHRDGTFIQHSFVPYQGAYGVSLLSGLATLFAVLRGSPWEITDPARQVIFDSVGKSFAPIVHDGFCLDMVRGRGIGRRSYGDHDRGREIAAAVLLLGESASGGERARWQAMVKGWATRDTTVPMLPAAERSDLAFHARLAAIMDDDAVPAAGEPPGHRLMAAGARAVHRGPGWCAGLSMASSRIGHYEHGNGENLRGWHTGSGMLYWWAEGHGDQYSDAFWPTVDPYRLPGTTVSTRRLPDGAGAAWGDTRTPARWVGGATDGRYACVGQHLYGLESTLEAYKSWFFLDDAVVCLGAGITARDGVPVETIVDNRRTDAGLTVDGREVLAPPPADGRKPASAFGGPWRTPASDDRPTGGEDRGAAGTSSAGRSAAMAEAGWAHLTGHGGYVLPGGARLHLLRERRADATGRVARGYVTLWLDHGPDPASAGYAYLLLPGATAVQTRARSADPDWLRISVNTADQQGIRVPSLGITAVNFWQGGATEGLTASGPCAVLVREDATGAATVTVADPRCGLDELTVTWDRRVAGVVHGHPLLAGAQTGRKLVLTFTGLADQAGASHTVTVRTTAPAGARS